MKNIVVIDEMKNAKFRNISRINCEDEMLRFDAPIMGKGKTGIIPLSEGVNLTYIEGIPEEAFLLQYSQYFQNRIMVCFTLKGTITHLLNNELECKLCSGQSMIYATQDDRSYISYMAEKSFATASLVFDPVYFDHCISRFFDSEDQESVEIIKRSIFKLPTAGTILDLCPEIRVILRQILGCRLTKNFRRVFLECKLFELMTFYLQSITGVDEHEVYFSNRDIEILQQIKQDLSDAESLSLSIQSICKRYGINRFKLTMGFQSIFNTSVLRYYRQQILQRAHERIATRQQTITQAAYHYGYSSVASFSKAFYKEYGYRPSMLQKMRFGQ